MTTLNAKANAAYHALVAETERENPGDVWAGFENERDAFEAGYEAAASLPVDREALARAAHRHYCASPNAETHELDIYDFDKADYILEVLALIGGDAK